MSSTGLKWSVPFSSRRKDFSPFVMEGQSGSSETRLFKNAVSSVHQNTGQEEVQDYSKFRVTKFIGSSVPFLVELSVERSHSFSAQLYKQDIRSAKGLNDRGKTHRGVSSHTTELPRNLKDYPINSLGGIPEEDVGGFLSLNLNTDG